MTNGLESLGRVRTQGLLLLVVAFAAGIAAGAAFENVRAGEPPPLNPRPREGFGMRGRGMDGLPPMFGQLGLSEEQDTQIRDILLRRRPATEAIMAETMPRLRALMDSVQAEVRAVLTDAQRVQLDSLMPGFMRRGLMERGRPGRRRPPGR